MTVDSDRWRQGLNNGHSMTDRTDTGSNVSSEQAERCDYDNGEVFTFGGDQALLTKFAARLAGYGALSHSAIQRSQRGSASTMPRLRDSSSATRERSRRSLSIQGP
jgi:hypothetical protein